MLVLEGSINAVKETQQKHTDELFANLDNKCNNNFKNLDEQVEIIACEITRETKKKSDILLQVEHISGQLTKTQRQAKELKE